MANAIDAQPNGSLAQIAAVDETALAPRDLMGPGGRYPATVDQSPDLASRIREFLRIVNRRKWIVLSIVGVIVTIGTIRTLMMTPLYTSTVRIQIDRNAVKVVEDGSVASSDGEYYNDDFLRTQYELLQSRSLAERVAMSTDLASDKTFFAPRSFSLTGYLSQLLSGPPEESGGDEAEQTDRAGLVEAAAGMVMGGRAVRPVPGSRLVDITYTDPVPARAQKIVAAYAEAYIASNLDKRFEANAYAKTFLEDQIKQLKFRTEESEKTLIEFGEKERILELNDKSSIVESNLAAANAALGHLISERIKNEQLWRQVDQAKGVDLPQLLTNGVIDGLRTKRNELVTEYQEKLETFKPGYPVMVQIQNRINEIDRQLATEIKTIRGSLKAAYESSANQEQELKDRIETLKTEALDLQKRSIQYNTLKREVETNRGLYNGLLQRYKEVDVAGGVGANNVFVVDRADLPGAPTSPRLSRSIIMSLMLGLGLGIGAALLLETFDDVILSMEDVERAGLSTLGVIPKAADQQAEVELAEPRSSLSEAYRSLCTSLQFTTERGLPRSIAITSGGPGEGKSLTSVAISQHFARMGLKVLLIDADLRNPSLHKKLRMDNSIGLSNYLTGACAPPDAFQKSTIPNLAIMTSGPLPPNAADLLAGARLMSLLTVSLDVFDLVVLDGPPVLGLADAVLLSNAAEATIFVIGAGQARRASVSGALKRLQHSRSPIIGSVLTKFDAKSAGYGYGYGYGSYGYGHYHYNYGGSNHMPQAEQTPQIAARGSRPA